MANKNIETNFINRLNSLENTSYWASAKSYRPICRGLRADLSALKAISYSLEQQILSLIHHLEIHCIYEESGCQNNINETVNKLKVEINKVAD